MLQHSVRLLQSATENLLSACRFTANTRTKHMLFGARAQLFTPKFSGDKMVASDKLIRPAPASLKAAIWQHFGFYEFDGKMDKTYAVCKMCRSQIKYFRNTANLRNHISRYHSEFGEKRPIPDGSQRTIEQAVAQLPPNSDRDNRNY